MTNAQVAELLEEIASMMELEGEERYFEVRAYRKAATAIGSMHEDVADIYAKKGMEGMLELPGVGKSIAKSIEEYIRTGRMEKHDMLKKKYPVDFTGLMKIQNLGAKRVYKLYKELGVKSVADLKKAIGQHKVSRLEGFGEKSEEELRKGLEFMGKGGKRMLLGTALPEAELIVRRIKEAGLVEEAVIAGSSRRMRETVGDLDILLTSGKPDKVMDFIAGMGEVSDVLVRGPTKTSVVLKIGLNCDFRVVDESNFGAALQYFTGSKDHGVLVRQIAVRKGYSLNEYQLSDRKGRNIGSRTEAEVYNRLGMDYIEPEMREARGEIELAQKHMLPRLIAIDDIKGDLQVHANPLGGVTDSLEDMVGRAIKIGHEYLGITNHSKSLYVEKGLNEKQLAKFYGTVDKMNGKLDNMRILKSAETDILKDGSLDLDRKTLESMDYRFAAVHSNMNMGRDEMTGRIVRALESGYVDILGHPTGRLINKRDVVSLDLDKIFEAAKDNGVVMEIDSQPDRLDLNDENIIRAKKYGLKFCIDTDAHMADQMYLLRFGLGTARRGWLTKDDVINTQDVGKLLRSFAK